MFLLRWCGKLLALPLSLLGQLLAALKTPGSLQILQAAYFLGRNSRDGLGVVGMLCKAPGSQAALEWLTRQLPNCRDSVLPAMAAAVAMDLNDSQGAWVYLQQAKRIGRDPLGIVESVELRWAAKYATPEDELALKRALEVRKDLAPHAARMVQLDLLWDELRDGKLQEARRRADRMRQIDECAHLRILLWVLCTLEGDPHRGNDYFDKAVLPDNVKLYYQVIGLDILGRREQSVQLLPELEAGSADLAAQARRFLQIQEPAV